MNNVHHLGQVGFNPAPASYASAAPVQPLDGVWVARKLHDARDYEQGQGRNDPAAVLPYLLQVPLQVSQHRFQTTCA